VDVGLRTSDFKFNIRRLNQETAVRGA